MRILHTADWHIGKVLHKYPLREELILFFDWLVEFIEKDKIDLLLVSGDIFDLANPAVKDRELYYQFLSRLIHLKIKVIITGGNHDAVGLLNAPQKILSALNIKVIGGAKENLEEELIPVYNKDEEVELIVAAVPFLRDRDLRKKDSEEKFTNRTEAIREGIKKHYAELADLCQSNHPHLPVIAMGHLYTKGALTSESEREIQVGNAAAVESSIFSEVFKYVALGHIHKPQIIGKNEYIRYSGSPIALSFSEKEDHKCLLVVELIDGQIEKPTVVPIPKFRELKKISGTLEEVGKTLLAYQPSHPLVSFVELEINEKTFSDITLAAVADLVNEYDGNASFTILKSRTHFTEGAKDLSAAFTQGENIEDLKPVQVFTKLMEQQELEEEKQKELQSAFVELLDELESEGL